MHDLLLSVVSWDHHDLLRGTPLQDTARQPPEPGRHVGVLGASAIIDNTDFGALLLGVPDTFGQLQMGEDRAIGPLLMSLTQVHVRKDISSYMIDQAYFYFLCI